MPLGLCVAFPGGMGDPVLPDVLDNPDTGSTATITEFTSLTTPIGSMKGTYQMVAEDGTHFEAEIPEFVLASPSALH